jgi:hypothetical protein
MHEYKHGETETGVEKLCKTHAKLGDLLTFQVRKPGYNHDNL